MMQTVVQSACYVCFVAAECGCFAILHNEQSATSLRADLPVPGQHVSCCITLNILASPMHHLGLFPVLSRDGSGNAVEENSGIFSPNPNVLQPPSARACRH